MKLSLSLAAAAFSALACAQQVPTRAALNAILVAGSTLDDFETVVQAHGTAEVESHSQLDSTTLFLGQGPLLVAPGSIYSGTNQALQWNETGYFGLTSRCVLWNTTKESITYTGFVQASGLDLYNYQGYAQSGSVDFYGSAGLLGTVGFALSGAAGESVFVGWQSTSGITSMTLTSANQEWAPIMDNHQYGAVPEPSSVAALGLGGLAWWRRRRARKA